MRLAEEVQKRRLQPRRPALAARHVLPGLVLELAVELGQHEEQAVALPGARRGRRADRLADPVVDHVGQRLHVLVRRADAEQHGRDFLLRVVSLEQVGDLAAQEHPAEAPRLREKPFGVGDLLPRARAGEVQQVGVLEELPGALNERHRDLGNQRRRDRAIHRRRRPGRGCHAHRAAAPFPQAEHHLRVQHAGFPRQQRVEAAERRFGEAERGERLGQLPGHPGEGLRAVPQRRVGLRPQFRGQAGNDLRGVGPIGGAEFPEQRMAAEMQVEVFAQFLDVIHREAALHSAARLLRQPQEQGGDVGGLGRRQVAHLEILQVGVGQDLHDVRLRHQPHRHGRLSRGRDAAHREAGHQPRAFLAALRVEVLQEVQPPVAVRRLQSLAGPAGERGHQVALAGLRRAEHRDAHRPLRRGAQPGRAPPEPAEVAGERRRVLLEPGAVRVQPRRAIPRRLGDMCRALPDCAHGHAAHGITSRPVSRQ